MRRVITNFGMLSTAARAPRHAARAVRALLERPCSARSPTGTAAIRATLQELPPTLQQTQSALTSAQPLRADSRPGVAQADPVRAGAGAGPAAGPAALPGDHGPDPDTRSGPSPARSQKPLKHINQASQAARRDDDVAHQGLQRAQPPVQRPRLQPARSSAPTRATCSGSRGSTTTPTPSSSPRTRAGRCGTASSSSPATPPGRRLRSPCSDPVPAARCSSSRRRADPGRRSPPRSRSAATARWRPARRQSPASSSPSASRSRASGWRSSCGSPSAARCR